ncbi:MAG TPA: methyltransferase domain-containing protein [Dehalococcoidia bacterium]|nr:methyltransferase domain-containing protein [Dehalococcoidia bacterium]
MSEEQSPDFPEYDTKTTPVWDNIAGWWDDRIGDGNAFQDYLIEPSQERLLELKPGERVLDIACGAGRFTRRMAAQGVTILAFDHSEKFIERAKQRTKENTGKIEYRVINATDKAAMLELGKNEFDAAVCTMAIMDMSSITPMISTLPELLKSNGRFVFSVAHPAFNSGTSQLIAEEKYLDGNLRSISGVKLTEYSQAFMHQGVGIPGQSEPQHYFHRSISMLFNACFKLGFVLDGIEEPTLPEELADTRPSPLNWVKLPQIPPVLVVRMRLFYK